MAICPRSAALLLRYGERHGASSGHPSFRAARRGILLVPTTAAGSWRWWLVGRAGRWLLLGANAPPPSTGTMTIPRLRLGMTAGFAARDSTCRVGRWQRRPGRANQPSCEARPPAAPRRSPRQHATRRTRPARADIRLI